MARATPTHRAAKARKGRAKAQAAGRKTGKGTVVASAARRRVNRKADKDGAEAAQVDPVKFPNLAARDAWDREQHVKRAMAAGLSRKEAVRHANAEVEQD